MVPVFGDHFLMDSAGAMNANAQPAWRNSLDIAQITLENLHGVLLRKIVDADTCYHVVASNAEI
jgi:hypothetical protein